MWCLLSSDFFCSFLSIRKSKQEVLARESLLPLLTSGNAKKGTTERHLCGVSDHPICSQQTFCVQIRREPGIRCNVTRIRWNKLPDHWTPSPSLTSSYRAGPITGIRGLEKGSRKVEMGGWWWWGEGQTPLHAPFLSFCSYLPGPLMNYNR